MTIALPLSSTLVKDTFYRILFFSTLLLCLQFNHAVNAQAINIQAPEILILNSYHKGYVWSDDVTKGIENVIYHSYPNAKIFIEYMDTKRNSSQSYMDKLTNLYKEKFAGAHYDIIIACDDNAINFIRKHPLFPSSMPMIYCGTGNIVIDEKNNKGNVTGVEEFTDIKATLELVSALQPQVNKVVVINDKTVTGQYIGRQFQQTIAKFNTEYESKKFDYIQLDDAPLSLLEQQVSNLSSDTIVFLLAYIRDSQGVYYSPEITANRLSQASSVPIYSVWDIFFNHGILGGKLLTAYLHGEATGNMAIEILNGKQPSDIDIHTDGGNQLLLDYRQLQRFNLPMSRVPKNGIVKNINYSSDRNALILLSYSHEDKWSNSVLDGIHQSLDSAKQDIKISTEFMDTKRYNDKSYINDLLLLYKNKYRQQTLDVIVVSDDNAFQFAQRYRNVLFPGVPIVFCGVNYLQNPQEMGKLNITGVTESYDILGTINMGLSLFPNTKNLYVINDQTTTGKANSLKLSEVSPKLPQSVVVTEIPPMSMQQLKHEITSLDDDTLILLMSFTTDKNNHKFSYESSIEMIHGNANRPIIGFWDFYVGQGLAAGIITSGFEQGRTAGSMALKILEGQIASNIPVITQSPVQPMVDYAQLKRFIKDDIKLDSNIKVLNQRLSFYERNETMLITGSIILVILLSLIIAQWFKIRLQVSFNRRLSIKAETDDLTGTKSRSFIKRYLRQAIHQCIKQQLPLCLCYIDLDGLKVVNDNFGHREGDHYILNVVKAIRAHIRSEDELCRMGGDEFVVVFKGCNRDKVITLSQQFNDELTLIAKNTNTAYPMKVSCGISSLDNSNPQTMEKMLEQADSDMYRTKRRQQKNSLQQRSVF